MRKKLVIISVDALGASDWDMYLKDLPTFSMLRREGALVEKVESVYPSLTYPAHTTIVTGVSPKVHGVINNTKLQPERHSPDWYWHQSDVKVETLYSAAKREGLSTAGFIWPCAAKSSIDLNIAEIFPNRIWENQIFVSLFSGTPGFILSMDRKYGHLRKGIQEPYLDNFITACVVDTLQAKKPDLALIHLVDVDSMRHIYGVHSEQAKEALQRQDERIRQIIEATRNAGTFENTVFAITGDHFQRDVQRMIRLNALFAEKGWLTSKPDGTVLKDYKVYAKSCDGSSYIYCGKKANIPVKEIKKELEQIAGIEKVLLPTMAGKEGADDGCILMVEAKEGYYFIDESVGKITEDTVATDIGKPERYRAVHGYLPRSEGYETTMVLFGSGIKKGVSIERASLVDEAPTFAEILGLHSFSSERLEGRCLYELLENERNEDER